MNGNQKYNYTRLFICQQWWEEIVKNECHQTRNAVDGIASSLLKQKAWNFVNKEEVRGQETSVRSCNHLQSTKQFS